jgi:hypothetical protein
VQVAQRLFKPQGFCIPTNWHQENPHAHIRTACTPQLPTTWMLSCIDKSNSLLSLHRSVIVPSATDDRTFHALFSGFEVSGSRILAKSMMWVCSLINVTCAPFSWQKPRLLSLLRDVCRELDLSDIHASVTMSTTFAQELLLRHPQQRLESPSRGTSAALHVCDCHILGIKE